MREIRLRLPEPHAAQDGVLQAAKRFNVLCCGRRWGKTVIGMDRVAAAGLAGKRVAWFAPTYKLLAEPWRTLQNSLRPVILKQNLNEKHVDFFGGGTLECWSLDDPDAGRGRAYHLIIIDEAAMVRDLEQAWQQSIRPMLSDYRGSVWFLSTPKGVANYFHALWRKGQDDSQPDWASWQMPTVSNPFIDPSEIESARTDIAELAFAQEYQAQFVTWEGAVFRRILDCVRDETKPTAPCAMIGVDWGRTNDYTVFTALSLAGEVMEIERFRGMEYSLQRARLRAMWERLGSRSWIMAELNSMGAPVVEQLQRDGMPVIGFQTTNASKSAIVEQLALAFERGTVKIPNDPVLIGELQAFEATPLSSGSMRYAAPTGQHDDTVLSLAFAWHGLIAPREESRYLDPNTGAYTQAPVPYSISPI